MWPPDGDATVLHFITVAGFSCCIIGDDPSALCSVAVQDVQLRAPIFHMEDIARVKDALAVEGNEQAPSSP